MYECGHMQCEFYTLPGDNQSGKQLRTYTHLCTSVGTAVLTSNINNGLELACNMLAMFSLYTALLYGHIA